MSIVNEGDHSGPNTFALYGNASEQAAALEFAVWNALYNSTAYGAIGGSVYTHATLDLNEQNDYDIYNHSLLSKGPNIPIYLGNVLEATGAAPLGNGQNGQDQEFFLLTTPVPEPTTLIAGALLLLPFGASTLRILRRKHAA